MDSFQELSEGGVAVFVMVDGLPKKGDFQNSGSYQFANFLNDAVGRSVNLLATSERNHKTCCTLE